MRTSSVRALARADVTAKRRAAELALALIDAVRRRGPSARRPVELRTADDYAAREERLLDYATDLEILSEVSRTLSEVSDPDQAAEIICTVVLGATGAVAVLLWELTGRELDVRRCEGALPAQALGELAQRARAGAQRSALGATTVVEQMEALDADGPSGEPLQTLDPELRLGSAWHEPMTSGGRLTGVLSILWLGELRDIERPRRLIGPLAHHAAVALERSRLLALLQEAARTDPLTGLANRRVWQETLAHELKRAGRELTPLSLVLIDIDRFKSYNDRFGHPSGDRLLQEAAHSWSRQLRATDMLARVGGEEFALILPSCPPADARLVAERVRAAMPGGETCSLGVVTWDGNASASALYEAADRALYVAKDSGRNRVEVALAR